MDWDSILAETADLLKVASDVWLQEAHREAQRASHEQGISAARAERRAKLRIIAGRMEQVAEVDARIALLETSPGIPSVEDFLHQLQTLRVRLMREAKRG